MMMKLISLLLCIIAISFFAPTGAFSLSTTSQPNTRREWMSQAAAKIAVGLAIPAPAFADDDYEYENPEIPVSPEEKCECR